MSITEENEQLHNKKEDFYMGVKLQGLWSDVINREMFEMSRFEIEIFKNYIQAMIDKVHKHYNGEGGFTSKTPKDDEQVARLQWMMRFIRRQQYKNRLQEVQAGLIFSMQNDIRELEIKNIALIQEMKQIKKNIKLDGKKDE